MNRRKLLRTAAVVGAGGAAVATAGIATAAGREGAPTYVFVNGANGTGMGFNALGLRGHRSVAVELPGHTEGHFPIEYQAPQDLITWANMESPMRNVGLDDYVQATIDVVKTVAEYGPVILVGQSMGGATITKVGNAIPEYIDHMVYDTAYCCVELETMYEYTQTDENEGSLGDSLAPWIVGDPQKIGAIRMNWRSADPEFVAAAKAAYLADGTDEAILSLLAALQPDESIAAITENAQVEKDTWGTIPRTYIRHTRDKMLPIALQNRMIDEADALTPDNPFNVHSVKASHVGTAKAHKKILEILVDLA
ncbi:alpha/beta fold hydrolase [Stackebrandtia nassauensis]|uniref:Esterase EstC n=1 Tax=Stackebrandtia nassauensis (strain DSM 44728 / CIP 108903 / NRRL B-16338 / NBRC 102104 / LLR-40K-21) TaxID=446470 RepID=D3PZI4_STANL|nr:alpha/beta hydrolase [Stackebrandtia nassauensis]ADD41658.1 esterase EstC [Stackebrandtia nassauensis DSM 44728]